MRARAIPVAVRTSTTKKKALTGAAVLALVLLCAQCFQATTVGDASAGAARHQGKHTVTLRWEASSSPVAGYNIYRSTTRGANYQRINTAPVKELSYTDSTVESGVTYYYVTRAVDAKGRESSNSNESEVKVP